ncbi:MAG: hypothetical protein KAY12_03240 [Arenimonas sp.]|nr:hypothetical protein [Arenimonas sp.]MBP8098237.1 hypothetical protein [Arenimonas sp.]
MSLEIIPVWKKITPELEAELVAFWISNKAIGDEKLAAGRAKEAICLIRSEQGAIVGVSTAQPRIVPRLRQPMYYYRQFFAEEVRGQHLAAPVGAKSREVLQQYELSLPKPQCIGLIFELENQVIAARRNEAQWKEGWTFIGYSPKGLHLRVSYFDGVRLHPPSPLKKPARARAAN